ncbi:MAG: CinA family protein, partial [Methylococcales bacterium]
IQMVEGALVNSDADIAVAVTGIAGPSGGTELKPIGTVFIAWGVKEGLIFCGQSIFSGNRTTIRKATVISALKSCIQQAKLENKISLTLYQKSEIYLKQLLKDKLPQNTQIFLFGSRAKGTAGGMADIDIGVLSESVVAKKILNDIKETIEQSFVPYDVDLVDFNAVSEAFKQQAMKKVIPWS